MNFLKICLIAAFLSGCKIWPSHGEGGMAEYRAPELWFSGAAEEAFLDELAALEAELRQLARHGGQLCQPAQVLKARRAVVRTKRDFYGQMYADAQRSMKAARVALGRLHWNQGQLNDCYSQIAQSDLAR